MSLYRRPDGLFASTLLEEQTWLEHSFGTAAAAPPPGYLYLKQVHSDQVLVAAPELVCGETEGDALATAEPGGSIAVKTADCVSILLADPRRRAVAAIHAGWKGTLAQIAACAVDRLATQFGSRPDDLVVALGPSIGVCCFEVGPEVACRFAALFPERADLNSQTHVDLREANRRVLLQAGVAGTRIDSAPPCSCCGGNEFYSWRRDHIQHQRMYSTIVVKR